MLRPHVARRRLFEHPAYVRVPNEARREAEGRRYHKGWELRFRASSEAEATAISDLARAAGFRPGGTFRKHSRFIVPIYGEEAVAAFELARR